MKNKILVLSILITACMFSACSNNGGTSDKSVTTTSGTAITTTAPAQTTTVATVTSEPDEAVTTEQTTTAVATDTETEATSESVETFSSQTTTSDKLGENVTEPTTVTTTSPTTTTKKPTVTTTTTKKKVTTTTTTAKKKTTTTTAVSGKTMYVIEDTIGFKVGKNLDWWDKNTSITISEGDKVTAYETVTADTPNGGENTFTKVKLANGTTTYVLDYLLDLEKPYVVQITQDDVDRLVAELQAYSDSIVKDRVLEKIERLKDKLPEGYDWETYLSEQYDKTPSNSSWHNVPSWYEYQKSQYEYTFMLYDDMLEFMKSQIDYEYSILPNSHQVIYAEYTTNSHTGATKWDLYLLY